MCRESANLLSSRWQLIRGDPPAWGFSGGYLSLADKRTSSGMIINDKQGFAPRSSPFTSTGETNKKERSRLKWGSRDSAVSTVTGYELDGRGFGVRVPVGARFFSSPQESNLATTEPLIVGSTEGRVKTGVMRRSLDFSNAPATHSQLPDCTRSFTTPSQQHYINSQLAVYLVGCVLWTRAITISTLFTLILHNMAARYSVWQ
jgi:hypothetical protein